MNSYILRFITDVPFNGEVFGFIQKTEVASSSKDRAGDETKCFNYNMLKRYKNVITLINFFSEIEKKAGMIYLSEQRKLAISKYVIRSLAVINSVTEDIFFYRFK